MIPTHPISDKDVTSLAPWIRMHLPSCFPGFDSYALIIYGQICAIFVLVM